MNFDRYAASLWETAPEEEAFDRHRREYVGGVGMDEEGNIVYAAPTMVPKLAKNLGWAAILFLDFDGATHQDRCSVNALFCRMPLIEEVLRDFPNVKVVISSSWREHYSLVESKRSINPVLADEPKLREARCPRTFKVDTYDRDKHKVAQPPGCRSQARRSLRL